MSVGTIRLDVPGTPGAGNTLRQSGLPILDFHAILQAVSGDAAPGAAPDAEMSRSVSLVGNLRKTVITYADGTSDMQTVVVKDDPVAIFPRAFFLPVIPTQKAASADSDLEPDIDGAGTAGYSRPSVPRRPAVTGKTMRVGVDKILAPVAHTRPGGGLIGRVLDLMV